MKALITLMLLIAIIPVFAQVQPYGKIDTADLKLTTCDFEPGANSMVLFDAGEIMSNQYSTELIRHKRIKIFNDKGKAQANVRIEFIKKHYIEEIKIIEAQTINLNNNVIEFTPIDKSQVYKEKIDKYRQAYVITFPNVKPGSVVEFKYKWSTIYEYFPLWTFQSDIPARYSQLKANVKRRVNMLVKKRQEFVKDTSELLTRKQLPMVAAHTWAMEKIPAYASEPFMPAEAGLQRLILYYGYLTTWLGVGIDAFTNENFGRQFNVALDNEQEILTKAAAQKDSAQKVAFIFDYVKNAMTWNNNDEWHTEVGVQKAWLKKTGNSTEINLALCNLLLKAGINACPTLISTPDNGAIDVDYPSLSHFNKTVVYVQADSVNYFILDATDKHNVYNGVPYDMLNLKALVVNPSGSESRTGVVTKGSVKNLLTGKNTIKRERVTRARLIIIQHPSPARETMSINAEIKPEGKMTGSVSISSSSYNRSVLLKRKDLKEKTYIEHVKGNGNNLDIKSLKFDNLEVDTLPLEQHIDFDLDLTQSDEKYIYFSANPFSHNTINPFLSETRNTDIEFTYKNISVISGLYKIPQNYLVETIPKTIHIKTEGDGISIKRMVAYEGNTIGVRYLVEYNKLYYSREEYPALKQFYKKMFEILNEPIVLKKR